MTETTFNKDQIYDILKKEIIDLKITPGSIISENEISKRFVVSRTPIRDVFLRLAQDNLVEILPQRGTRVTLIDIDLVMANIYMRTIVETKILKDCLKHFDASLQETLLASLKEQKQACENSMSPDKFYELDRDFHCCLFSFVRQKPLWTIIDQMKVHYMRFRMLDVVQSNNIHILYEEHVAIYEALVSKDAKELEALTKHHLNGGIKRLKNRLNEFSDYFVQDKKEEPVG